MADRRRGILWVSAELMAEFLTTDKGWRIKQGIPSGCEVLGVNWSIERHAFGICLEHESFGSVQEGCMLPVLDGPVYEEV